MEHPFDEYFSQECKNNEVNTYINLLNAYVECIKFSLPKDNQLQLVQGY